MANKTQVNDMVTALSTTFHHASGGVVQLRHKQLGSWLNQMITAFSRTLALPKVLPLSVKLGPVLRVFPAPEYYLLRAFLLFAAGVQWPSQSDLPASSTSSERVAFRNLTLHTLSIFLGSRADDMAGDRAVRHHNATNLAKLRFRPDAVVGTIIDAKETKSSSKAAAKPPVVYTIARLQEEDALWDSVALLAEYTRRSAPFCSTFVDFVPLFLAEQALLQRPYANALSRTGIATWAQLVRMPLSQLQRVKGIGTRSASLLHMRVQQYKSRVPPDLPLDQVSGSMGKVLSALTPDTCANIRKKLFLCDQPHSHWLRHSLASAFHARAPVCLVPQAREHLRMTGDTYKDNYAMRAQVWRARRPRARLPSLSELTIEGIPFRLRVRPCIIRTIVWSMSRMVVPHARSTWRALIGPRLLKLVPIGRGAVIGSLFPWRRLIYSWVNIILVKQVLRVHPWTPAM